MFRLKASHLQAYTTFSLPEGISKKDCGDLYYITLIDLHAHRHAFIQNINNSPPSSAEVKNEWSYTAIPLYVFREKLRCFKPLSVIKYLFQHLQAM
jgi:hypothetical protein